MDSLLFPTCFYFMWKFSDSVSLHSQYPFDGKDNARVGYCVEILSRNTYTYLIMYFFPCIQDNIKAVNGRATTKQNFLFSNLMLESFSKWVLHAWNVATGNTCGSSGSSSGVYSLLWVTSQNPGTAAWLGHCHRSASLGKGAWGVRFCFCVPRVLCLP